MPNFRERGSGTPIPFTWVMSNNLMSILYFWKDVSALVHWPPKTAEDCSLKLHVEMRHAFASQMSSSSSLGGKTARETQQLLSPAFRNIKKYCKHSIQRLEPDALCLWGSWPSSMSTSWRRGVLLANSSTLTGWSLPAETSLRQEPFRQFPPSL